ncbi:LysM peptidoglycan-binding domain-containing protein [Jannaschia sp. Os4]|uniref:LysM peptidoglycan-binding domain-containing protein n=1 Tax=Jannaschia sp. Os4 TaxID=2807617 RepID=UPI00193A7536|nr:LysM domain-containing protein [Jannaschia sp. Os4]MBM2577398.1 LysM peptidoglycan-binding domain-containing protein [Jannaschia sp. Os4]
MFRSLPALTLACLWGVPAAASICGPSVVVAPGDTMNKIAARCGVTTESIQAANPLVDPYRMAVGQALTIDPNAVLPGLPGNRPPDPDGAGPFLSWIELAPDEPDPALGGTPAPTLAAAPSSATGAIQTTPLPAEVGLGAVTDTAAGDDLRPTAPTVVGATPLPDAILDAVPDAPGTPAAPAAPGPVVAAVAPSGIGAPVNPYDPALAAQVPPFPITTNLGTPPRPSVVRSRPAATRQAAPQRARPQPQRQRSQPVIRLSRAQAAAALAAIRAGQRSGTIGGLNLADPRQRRALRRALGQ